MKRIRKRARSEESSINLEFLESLNKALQKEVAKIQDQRRVITIDSVQKDFANDESVKKEIIELIFKLISPIRT